MQGLLLWAFLLDKMVALECWLLLPLVALMMELAKESGATTCDSKSEDKLNTRRTWQCSARRSLIGIRGYYAVI
jgi:hypothetical protein